MAAPPTAQEVQALRGRIAQLEAELTAANTATHTKTFVGSAYSWNGSTGAIDSNQPSVANATPTARNAAELDYTKWKTANPCAIIVHEEYTWYGLNQGGSYSTCMAFIPSLTITIRYRNP